MLLCVMGMVMFYFFGGILEGEGEGLFFLKGVLRTRLKRLRIFLILKLIPRLIFFNLGIFVICTCDTEIFIEIYGYVVVFFPTGSRRLSILYIFLLRIYWIVLCFHCKILHLWYRLVLCFLYFYLHICK